MASVIITLAIAACGSDSHETEKDDQPTPSVSATNITLSSPGMLSDKITPEKKYYTASLKIKGKLNGTDIWLLRDMAGCDENMKQTNGTLAYLDLSEAQIVSGGKAYAKDLYTEDNAVSESMFYNCKSLVKIVLPSNTEKIGHNAFVGCNGIKSIDMPKGLKSMIGKPFESGVTLNITDLKVWNNLDLSNSIFSTTYINDEYNYTYKGKTLKTLDIPSGVTTMSDNFTFIKDIETVNIPSTVKTIGKYALSAKNFKSINIADGVEELGEYAFRNDSQLKEIKIPKSVKSIRSCCFIGCTGLTKIIVPQNVEAIWESVFSGCTNITSIDLSKCKIETLNKIFYNCSNLTEILLPNTIKIIRENAFSKVTALRSITIPESVETICEYPFSGCNSLEEIHMKPKKCPVTYKDLGTTGKKLKIYVPKGAKDSYDVSPWKNHTIIEE